MLRTDHRRSSTTFSHHYSNERERVSVSPCVRRRIALECLLTRCICRTNVVPIQILVPGAGLGRLSWEFARLGYACQGNEVSLYMLIASHFVLNKYTNHSRALPCQSVVVFSRVDAHTSMLTPFIHGYSISATIRAMKINYVLYNFLT